MRILMTGCTGYLGSKLLLHITDAGHEVVVLKRRSSSLYRIKDLLPKISKMFDVEDGIDRIFESEPIDGILHCATNYGRRSNDPLGIIQANLTLPLTLLDRGSKSGARFFINTDTLIDKRVNEYSLSKRHFADWLQAYGSKLVCVNMALEHFYGPGDDTSKFVAWVIDNILNKASVVPLTPGEQTRDFIYISDVVSAFMVVIAHINGFQKGLHGFEIGSGRSTSIRNLVEMISSACQPHQTRLDFGAQSYRVNEVMAAKVDIEPLVRLGWQPAVSLAEGIKATVSEEERLRHLR